jgi:hypothetical protein
VGGITGAKAVRRSRRRKNGPPTTRIAAAWTELTDFARDAGHTVPPGTRREQVRAIGRIELAFVCERADEAIFAEGAPTPETAHAYWIDMMATRKGMVKSLRLFKRWRARLSLRSLLSHRSEGASRTADSRRHSSNARVRRKVDG